jgi:hypothetical protein
MHTIRRIMTFTAAVALLPLLAVLLSAVVAGVLGCEVNEGGPMPCVVAGIDIGSLLSSMMVTGWFALFTIPLLMGLVAIWGLLELYVWQRQRRKARRMARATNA